MSGRCANCPRWDGGARWRADRLQLTQTFAVRRRVTQVEMIPLPDARDPEVSALIADASNAEGVNVLTDHGRSASKSTVGEGYWSQAPGKRCASAFDARCWWRWAEAPTSGASVSRARHPTNRVVKPMTSCKPCTPTSTPPASVAGLPVHHTRNHGRLVPPSVNALFDPFKKFRRLLGHSLGDVPDRGRTGWAVQLGPKGKGIPHGDLTYGIDDLDPRHRGRRGAWLRQGPHGAGRTAFSA